MWKGILIVDYYIVDMFTSQTKTELTKLLKSTKPFSQNMYGTKGMKSWKLNPRLKKKKTVASFSAITPNKHTLTTTQAYIVPNQRSINTSKNYPHISLSMNWVIVDLDLWYITNATFGGAYILVRWIISNKFCGEVQ